MKTMTRSHACTTCLTREAVACGLMVSHYDDALRPDAATLLDAAKRASDALAGLTRARSHDTADAYAEAAAAAVADLLREVAAMTHRYEMRPTCRCDE